MLISNYPPPAVENYGVFGNGADGDLVFDGISTVLGITPSSNTYTLTRAIYARDITVASGVTVVDAGYPIHVTRNLFLYGTIGSVANAGAAGGNASGATKGSAGAAASTLAAGFSSAPAAAVAGADGANGG